MTDTLTLDVRGEICPYPLFEAKARMEELSSGATLTVWLDYPLALDNVTRWAENAGHEVVSVEEVDTSEWRVLLRHG